MQQRLQKILSSRGVASRRKSEEMIAEGKVTVNGRVACLGDSADPDVDTITISDMKLPEKEQNVYLMLNKPKGYVTTLSDEKGRPNAAQLVADCGVRVYPVGRLDMDSEGLLIFTNDGELANHLMHPKNEVNKTYLVTVLDYSDKSLELLSQPIELDGYRIRKPEVVVLSVTGMKAVLKVTIHEGRNRQIRRMCALAGMQVIRLVRIAEGKVLLGKLEKGHWRYLNHAEIVELNK